MSVMKKKMMKVGDDDGYLVMKVIIVEEVMTCDVSPVAMFLKVNFHFFQSFNISSDIEKMCPPSGQTFSP